MCVCVYVCIFYIKINRNKNRKIYRLLMSSHMRRNDDDEVVKEFMFIVCKREN